LGTDEKKEGHAANLRIGRQAAKTLRDQGVLARGETPELPKTLRRKSTGMIARVLLSVGREAGGQGNGGKQDRGVDTLGEEAILWRLKKSYEGMGTGGKITGGKGTQINIIYRGQ